MIIELINYQRVHNLLTYYIAKNIYKKYPIVVVLTLKIQDQASAGRGISLQNIGLFQ